MKSFVICHARERQSKMVIRASPCEARLVVVAPRGVRGRRRGLVQLRLQVGARVEGGEGVGRRHVAPARGVALGHVASGEPLDLHGHQGARG
eukprot:scaffold9374_cov63-Phaeocystis_antarctica.AAC.1